MDVRHAGLVISTRLIWLATALLWLLGFASLVLLIPHAVPGTTDFSRLVSAIVIYSIPIAIVGTVGILVAEEKVSRKRAERLVGDLELSNRDLNAVATNLREATEERNLLIHEINSRLGASLSLIEDWLEQATAVRPIDSDLSDRAIRTAKSIGSDALRDVRHSVGLLRAQRPDDRSRIADVADVQSLARPSFVRRLLSYAFPRTFDLVPTVAFLGYLVMYLGWSGDDHPLWSVQSVLASLALLGFIVVDRLEVLMFGERTPPRARRVLMIARVLLCALFGGVAGLWWLVWVLPLVQYVGFSYYGNKGGLGLLFLIWMVYVAFGVGSLLTHEPSVTLESVALGFVPMTVELILVLIPTQAMLRERRMRLRVEDLVAEGELVHRRLSNVVAVAAAESEERNRLAREIHDGLGHYLTVINVQLEKALAFRSIDPVSADAAIRDVERLVTDALDEVQGAGEVLNPASPEFSLGEAVQKLVDNFGSRPMVTLTILGDDTDYDPQNRFVLYRVLQESLTNVHRHADASHVTISLSFGEVEATLVVTDDGRGVPSDLPVITSSQSETYGLRGARERVERVGGRLTLTSKGVGGTRLILTVPKAPDASGQSDAMIRRGGSVDGSF